MPLSENEQRILSEIERRFYESDPDFAREVSESTIYRHAARMIRMATLAWIAGLAIMITQFSSRQVLGFAGFVLLFFASYVIFVNLRKVGRASWQEFMFALRSGTLRDQMRENGEQVRHRFHRRRRKSE